VRGTLSVFPAFRYQLTLDFDLDAPSEDPKLSSSLSGFKIPISEFK